MMNYVFFILETILGLTCASKCELQILRYCQYGLRNSHHLEYFLWSFQLLKSLLCETPSGKIRSLYLFVSVPTVWWLKILLRKEVNTSLLIKFIHTYVSDVFKTFTLSLIDKKQRMVETCRKKTIISSESLKVSQKNLPKHHCHLLK